MTQVSVQEEILNNEHQASFLICGAFTFNGGSTISDSLSLENNYLHSKYVKGGGGDILKVKFFVTQGILFLLFFPEFTKFYSPIFFHY